MRPTIRNPWLDTATAGLVHLIPFALVLTGRFGTLDVLIVYAVESVIGLALVTIRLIRHAGTLPRREVALYAAGGVVAAVVTWGFFAEWGEVVWWIAETTDWTADRLFLAMFVGLTLTVYAWSAGRSASGSIGAGRQLWLMLVLLWGITFGTSATEYYLQLAEVGWPHTPWMEGGRHVVAAWFARTVESMGGHPEAFAAVFVTGVMAFNETLTTALRHLWPGPEPSAAETDLDLSRQAVNHRR